MQRRDFQMQVFGVAESEHPVGYWHLTRVPSRDDTVGVSILLLRSGRRNQGLGRELILAASQHLGSVATEFWSRVYLKNTPAIEFWASMGFVRLIRHRETFVLPPEQTPSIILAKDLRPERVAG